MLDERIIKAGEALEAAKEKINERFGIKMHVHDGCMMQSFSFDEKASDELVSFINMYFENSRYKVIFSSDGLYFHLEDKK